MKTEGPTLIPAKYTCKNCKHTRYRGGYIYWCQLLFDINDLSEIVIFNNETPIECPLLLKQTHKDKLKQIGND